MKATPAEVEQLRWWAKRFFTGTAKLSSSEQLELARFLSKLAAAAPRRRKTRSSTSADVDRQLASLKAMREAFEKRFPLGGSRG